jgi:hypothetical protein
VDVEEGLALREDRSYAEIAEDAEKTVELHEPTARVDESKIRRSEDDWKRFESHGWPDRPSRQGQLVLLRVSESPY